MASMCETCKCSTYYNEDLDMYSCENECPCCNDPDYESDWDTHIRLIKQIQAYLDLSIQSYMQDSEKLNKQMEAIEDLDSDEYKDLEVEDIHLTGKMSGLMQALAYIKEVE